MSERILSVLVEDKPGVLARISSTISRRGFNINSLSVHAITAVDRAAAPVHGIRATAAAECHTRFSVVIVRIQ